MSKSTCLARGAWGDALIATVFCERLAIVGRSPYIPVMNRRDFTKSIAALGLAPALPALPASGAAAAAAPAYTPYMYGLGAHMARSIGQCSPEMLMQKLHLAPGAARAMQAQLIKGGILSAPNSAGLAMAARPYMQGASMATGSLSAAGRTARTMLRDAMRDEMTEDPESGPES